MTRTESLADDCYQFSPAFQVVSRFSDLFRTIRSRYLKTSIRVEWSGALVGADRWKEAWGVAPNPARELTIVLDPLEHGLS